MVIHYSYGDMNEERKKPRKASPKGNRNNNLGGLLMTTVKELIEELRKQPQNADVVIWEWTSKGALIRHTQILLRPVNTKIDAYMLGISETLPPIKD